MKNVSFKAWDTKRKMFTNFIIVDNMFKFMDKVTGVWFRDDEQKRFKVMKATGFESRDRPSEKEEHQDFIPFTEGSKIPF